MTPDTGDRYLGALLGMAVGDALGAPLRFMGAEQILIKHGRVTEFIGGGWLDLRPGETTQETALAAVLARSLAEADDFSAEDVAGRYRAWLAGAPKDVDGVTRSALEAMDEGYAVGDAARRALELSTDQAASNGTLVRAVPIALRFRREPARAIRTAATEAALTHADPRCAGGSAAVVAVLLRILAGETDRGAILEAAYDDLETTLPDVPNVLPDPTTKPDEGLRATRFVVDTLETALVRWFRDPDLETCLVRTINLGGDSNATGALVGALAGASWGGDAIPRRWARAVQDRSALSRLARSLLERSEATGR